MKTLCKIESNVSLYSFEDSEIINQTIENTLIGDPIQWVIADCNSENSLMYNNATLPTNWKPQKYIFDGINWSLNPDYVEPENTIS
jgi:hypothetical protein